MPVAPGGRTVGPRQLIEPPDHSAHTHRRQDQTAAEETLGIFAAAVFGLGASLAVMAPAEAARLSLRFHGAQYDSPGKDDRSNASRNAEWVSPVNTGKSAVNLKGYTIRDKAGKSYRFGNVKIAGKGGRV